jgi:hypothetical protein
MQARQSGYYWIKYESEWKIGQWWFDGTLDKYFWVLFDRCYEDHDFEEIDENRIVRGNDLKKAVGFTDNPLLSDQEGWKP